MQLNQIKLNQPTSIKKILHGFCDFLHSKGSFIALHNPLQSNLFVVNTHMEQILSEAPGNKRIEGRKIRVGTFNVHSWRDANLVSNGRRVLNNLQSQNIDIVSSLQVQHSSLYKGMHARSEPS